MWYTKSVDGNRYMTFIAQLFYFIHVHIVLSNQTFYISLLNTVVSIIIRVEVVILYYSLHINRVFSRYTLTEIQIMTSSNVSLLHFFLSVTIFVCLIPIIVQIVFYYRVAVLLWYFQSSWIRHVSEIAIKENIKYYYELNQINL